MCQRRQSNVADETSFVLKFIAKVAPRPKPRVIFAVVHEPGTVEIGVAVKGKIEIAEGAFAAWVHHLIDVLANVMILIPAEAVPPLGRRSYFDVGVGKEIVLAGKLVAVWRQILAAVEIEE